MLCFPSFLTISYRFPWCFSMFPLVFLQFPRVFLLLPHSVSLVSYFRFCWPVLQNTSAKYSSFFLPYNRETNLTNRHQIWFGWRWIKAGWLDFWKRNVWCCSFNCYLHERKSASNYCWKHSSCTRKQQHNYSRPHQVPNNIKVDQKVLLKNQKRDDRLSSKFSFECRNPYTVEAISEKYLCSLINKTRKLLKNKMQYLPSY